MGLTTKLEGKKIYLDTNIFIYLLEDFQQYRLLMDEFISGLENRKYSCFTSELTLAELLVPAFKKGNSHIIIEYKKILNDPQLVTLISTTQDIYIHSASNRANFNLKLPDAIHVATAQSIDSDIFLTNDKKIRTPKKIETIILDDFL